MPAPDREPYSWLLQPPPDQVAALAPLPAGHRTESHPSAVTPPALAAAAGALARGGEYHSRAMARVRRLWEVAAAPSKDLSTREAEAAVRLCEHLLYLQRTQRASLRQAFAVHAELAGLASALEALAANGGSLPKQAATRQRLFRAKEALDGLCEAAAEQDLVLAAATAAEPAQALARFLPLARVALARATARLRAGKAAVDAAVTPPPGVAAGLVGGSPPFAWPLLVTLPAVHALHDGVESVRAALADLAAVAAAAVGVVGREPAAPAAVPCDWRAGDDRAALGALLPGFPTLLQALEDGARTLAEDGDALEATADVSWEEVEASCEAAVQAALLWAQNLAGTTHHPLCFALLL